MVVFTVNKVVDRKHHFTTSCDIWNRIYGLLSVPVTTEKRVKWRIYGHATSSTLHSQTTDVSAIKNA